MKSKEIPRKISDELRSLTQPPSENKNSDVHHTERVKSITHSPQSDMLEYNEIA